MTGGCIIIIIIGDLLSLRNYVEVNQHVLVQVQFNAPRQSSSCRHPIMASVSVLSVIQQLAGLDISNKQPTATSSSSARPVHAKQPQPHTAIDIGRYDGGFEIDNEKRGEKVYGKAAEDLALDSSISRYVST